MRQKYMYGDIVVEAEPYRRGLEDACIGMLHGHLFEVCHHGERRSAGCTHVPAVYTTDGPFGLSEVNESDYIVYLPEGGEKRVVQRKTFENDYTPLAARVRRASVDVSRLSNESLHSFLRSAGIDQDKPYARIVWSNEPNRVYFEQTHYAK